MLAAFIKLSVMSKSSLYSLSEISDLPLYLRLLDTSTVPVGAAFLIKNGFESSVFESPFLSVAVTLRAYAPLAALFIFMFCDNMPSVTLTGNSSFPAISLPFGAVSFAVADTTSDASVA